MLYTFYKSDNLHMQIEEGGGFVFLHLDVREYSKESLKEIKSVVDTAAETFKGKGHDRIFAFSREEKSVRFWNLIRKCSSVTKFGESNECFLGHWEI